MRNFILLLAMTVITFNIFCDIPDGYYDSAEGLSGETLKNELHNIIDNHVEFSYDYVKTILKYSDEDPDNTNNVILLYTGWSYTKDSFGGGVSDWNREHVWAKSHGDFGNNPPCGTDAHHLRPTDTSVNSARGSLDFDEGGSPYVDGDGATGCFRDGDSWEPRDEVKGDVARMLFYMATRYEGDNGELDLEVINGVNTSPDPEHGDLEALYQWHLEDPVDDWERRRNDRIYEYQENRNPFIDHPEYANYIWGNETPGAVVQFTISQIELDESVGSYNLLTSIENSSITSSTILNIIINGGTAVLGDDFEEFTSQITFPAGFNGDIITEISIIDDNIIEDDENIILGLELISGEDVVIGPNSEFELLINDNDGQQSVNLFSESFESEISDWVIFSSSSDSNWLRENETGGSNPDNAVDGSYYMYMNNYNADNSSEDWLITPAISLENYINLDLSFYAWTKYSDLIDGLKVMISTDYITSNNPANAIWNVLDCNLPSQNSAEWVLVDNIDLSQYENEESIHIGFLYESTGTGAGSTTAWAIDKVDLIGVINTENQDEINEVSKIHMNSVYPSPFFLSSKNLRNQDLVFNFTLSEDSKLSVDMFNIKGQKVSSIPDKSYKKGNQVITWKPFDRKGNKLQSGVYFYKIQSIDYQIMDKFIIID